MKTTEQNRTPFAAWFALGVIVLSIILGVIWRWTPLYDRYGTDRMLEIIQGLPGHWWTWLAIMGIYILGGLVLFMHAVLLWTTVFVFDPWHAFLYAELGTLASGVVTYGLGRIARPEFVRWIAGSYLGRVSEALGKRGIRTLLILHWFPICPYSILNFLSGATHVSFSAFLIGTIGGCTPGILLICFFGNAIRRLLSGHHWLEAIPVLIAVVFVILGSRYIKSRLTKKPSAT